MPADTGPYIQAALFCDMVIEGKDGTWSLIRVIDTVTHTAVGPEAPVDMPRFPYQLKAAIMLKSGRAKGRQTFKLVMERPDAQRTEIGTGTIHFEGDYRGNNIILNLNVFFEQEGAYWFDFYVDDDLKTRMPLRVLYNRVSSGSPGQ
jgi:hypothetical protein